MISLAFWATVINYLDRQTLSVAAPVLRAQFHMSNVEYSRVVTAFMLAYTIMNGVSGPLIDRLGTRVGYALCIGWWSAASVLQGFARGALSLGVFRFLLGVGEAGNWPAGVKVVSEWFPPRERAMACGVFNSGSSLGAILAPPLVAFILLTFGWRTAFVTVGAVGFLWLLFWWPIYRTPAVAPDSAAPPVQTKAAPAQTKINLRDTLRVRFVWAFMLAKIFMDPVWYFYIFWFPEYLKSARHFDMASIGKYAWMPFAIAGAGNFAGGALSSWLLARGVSTTVTRKGSITFFAALMTSAIPAVLVESPWISMAMVSIAMMGYTGCLANMLAMPADVFPQSAVASVYGLGSMGSGFGGMVFSLITGWVVDHYSYTPVFIGFGIVPLICALVMWTLMGPLTRTAALD